MKRLLAFVPLLLLSLVALNTGWAQGEKKAQSFSSEYYPLKVGLRWIYQGLDPKEKIAVACERMEPIKRRVTLPNGNDRVDILESYLLRITNGDKALLEQVFVTDEGVYRYATGGKEIVPPLRFLKLPVTEGDTWSVNSQSETVPLKGEFTVSKTTIDLPGKKGVAAWLSQSKNFTVGDHKLESSYWFVPGVGVVKQHIKDRKTDVTIVLEEFRGGAEAVAPVATPPTNPALPTLPKLPPPVELK